MPLASCLAFALTGAMHLQVVHCPKIALLLLRVTLSLQTIKLACN